MIRQEGGTARRVHGEAMVARLGQWPGLVTAVPLMGHGDAQASPSALAELHRYNAVWLVSPKLVLTRRHPSGIPHLTLLLPCLQGSEKATATIKTTSNWNENPETFRVKYKLRAILFTKVMKTSQTAVSLISSF